MLNAIAIRKKTYVQSKRKAIDHITERKVGKNIMNNMIAIKIISFISKFYGNPYSRSAFIYTMHDSNADISISWIENVVPMLGGVHPGVLFSERGSIENGQVLSKVYPWIYGSIDFLICMLPVRVYMAEITMRLQIFGTSLRERIKIGIFSQEGFAVGKTGAICKDNDILDRNSAEVGTARNGRILYRNGSPRYEDSNCDSNKVRHILGNPRLRLYAVSQPAISI